MHEEDPPPQSELEEIVDDLEKKAVGHVVRQSRDQGDDDAESVVAQNDSTESGTSCEPTD